MARVTTAEVAAIYKGNFSDNTELQPFIDTATLLIDETLVSSGLSAARLTQIEKYLTAHLAVNALDNGGLKKRRIEDTEDEFHSRASLTGLNSTPFGQQVIMLDSTGLLMASAAPKLKAQFTVIGRKKSAGIAEED